MYKIITSSQFFMVNLSPENYLDFAKHPQGLVVVEFNKQNFYLFLSISLGVWKKTTNINKPQCGTGLRNCKLNSCTKCISYINKKTEYIHFMNAIHMHDMYS